LANGYLPEALLNFVAFLGWNPKTEKEIFSLSELIEAFDLAKINKSGAVLDMNKLDWLNGLYIRQMDIERLTTLAIPFLEKSGIEVKNFKPEYLKAILNLEKERLKKLSQIGEGSGYYFKQPEYEANLLVWKKSDAADAKQKLSELSGLLLGLDENKFSKENLETSIKNFIAEKGYDNGSVLWPLRVALTGQERSAGPFEVCAALALGLGKQEIITRIKTAVEKLS
jgi:glutamyl/glutaminyl-tRNA synthetase